MSVQPDHRISFEEYFGAEQQADSKHEYDDGYLTAMAGATARHVTITQNLVGILRPGLRGTGCNVYSTDMMLRVAPGKGYYPDVFVTCDPRDRAENLVKHHPRLVVEVLSVGTETRDRGIKWAAYRRCETLEDYVLVSQYQQSIEVYSRSGDVWVYRAYGPGEIVHLAGMEITLPMDMVYEDVTWESREE
jgi:Uma2 family endonuclease